MGGSSALRALRASTPLSGVSVPHRNLTSRASLAAAARTATAAADRLAAGGRPGGPASASAAGGRGEQDAVATSGAALTAASSAAYRRTTRSIFWDFVSGQSIAHGAEGSGTASLRSTAVIAASGLKEHSEAAKIQREARGDGPRDFTF